MFKGEKKKGGAPLPVGEKKTYKKPTLRMEKGGGRDDQEQGKGGGRWQGPAQEGEKGGIMPREGTKFIFPGGSARALRKREGTFLDYFIARGGGKKKLPLCRTEKKEEVVSAVVVCPEGRARVMKYSKHGTKKREKKYSGLSIVKFRGEKGPPRSPSLSRRRGKRGNTRNIS